MLLHFAFAKQQQSNYFASSLIRSGCNGNSCSLKHYEADLTLIEFAVNEITNRLPSLPNKIFNPLHCIRNSN